MSNRLKYSVVTASTVLLAVLVLGGSQGKTKAGEDAYKHFAVLSEVYSYIKSSYVEEPDLKSVTLGALNGLLESIDPFASYLSADQYKQYLKARETAKGESGLLLMRRSGYVSIVDVLPDSPAARAGLDTLDIIEAINGVSTRDMPLAYAEMLLQSDPGKSVELTVLRVRQGTESEKITLVLEPRKIPALAARILQPGIGYLKVPTLEGNAVQGAKTKLAELERQGAGQLVLDLRDNGWGEVETGIALADLFLDSGQIASLEGQKLKKQAFTATAENTAYKKPMVVIANRGTAGGAEIAAMALLDSKRADVVGERTLGDAALRRALTIEDGGAVILAVAKYSGPSGKAISETGVTPTLVVAETEAARTEEEEEEPTPAPAQPPSEDLPLKKAVEVLTLGLEAAKKEPASRATGQSTTEPGRIMTPLGIPKQ